MADQTILINAWYVPESIDAEFASTQIRAYPGRTVVEMVGVPPESAGGILIANGQGTEWREQNDMGVVLSAGKGVPLYPGQVVIIDHEHGKRIEGAILGAYEPQGEVRMYGCAAQTGGRAVPIAWWRSILATVDMESEIKALYPCGKWVLIERPDCANTSEGGIYLPDSALSGTSEGRVIAAGAFVRGEVKPGEWVFYMTQVRKELSKAGVLMKKFIGSGVMGRSLILIQQDAVLCAIPSKFKSVDEPLEAA